MKFENILIHKEVAEGVAHIQLNRPKALNALNGTLMLELSDAFRELDADPKVRAIVLSGNERAFAAGSDIKMMAEMSAVDVVKDNRSSLWEHFRRVKKPIIAAVSGFALGGGCELMMTCDMVVASDTAKFGQPEINLGIMPGAGGTQRMARAVGKVVCMELVLTGRFLTAQEALMHGLVNKVVRKEVYLKEAIRMATKIAEKSSVAVQLAKESVNQAFNTGLEEGLTFERRNFALCFSSEDQKEGMSAFLEKRAPEFKGK